MNIESSRKGRDPVCLAFGLVFMIAAGFLAATMTQLPSAAEGPGITPDRALVSGLGLMAFSMSILMFDIARVEVKPSTAYAPVIGIFCGFGFIFWALYHYAQERDIPFPF